jgi:glycogen phosphorylase
VFGVELDTSPAGIGETRSVRAAVDLGGLSPDEVDVEAVHGRLDGNDEIENATAERLAFHDGVWTGAITTAATGRYGAVVRVRPTNPSLSSNLELGLERRG